MSDPDLPTLILNHAGVPAECIKECRSHYYMYVKKLVLIIFNVINNKNTQQLTSTTNRFAGLMNGQQCYCGSKYGRKGMSTSCTVPCSVDPSNFCGSQEAMSIYATGQKGTSNIIIHFTCFSYERI